MNLRIMLIGGVVDLAPARKEAYNMSWNYAELSKAAKNSGGPEQLMANLVREGRNEMLPWMGLAFITGTLVTVGVQKTVKYFRGKRADVKREAENARATMIQGINEYDDAQNTGGELE